jgi:hypothetical protein
MIGLYRCESGSSILKFNNTEWFNKLYSLASYPILRDALAMAPAAQIPTNGNPRPSLIRLRPSGDVPIGSPIRIAGRPIPQPTVPPLTALTFSLAVPVLARS